MATYEIVGSYPTVRSITPTLTQAIQYTTIRSLPSGVVAALPLDQGEFDNNTVGPILQAFTDAIDEVMNIPNVIAGIGSQTVDPNGLLADFVVFTVQYSGPGAAASGVTATADVPVGYLNFTDAQIGQVSLANVDALINKAYESLRSAAGG